MGPLSCLIPITMTAILEGESPAGSSFFPEFIEVSQAAIVVQWYRRWYNVKRVFPLAVKKAQALICVRAGLFNVYTWVSLACVEHLIRLHT
jgi:hypothetical protein